MPRAKLWQTLSRALSSPRAVFLVALLVRLRVLSQLLPESAWRYFYQFNEPARIAWAVVSGFGFSSPWPNTPLAPTAQQPPVYPYLLAGVFRLAGAYTYVSLWVAVGLNAVLSALTAVLILQLGRKLFGAPTGILAAWVWSCWLYEAAASVRLWESSLSALLLAVGLLCLPKLVESDRISEQVLFGALAGLAALTNTTSFAVFLFFWMWLWIGKRRRSALRKTVLTSIAVCLLVLLPWTIRNFVTFHRIIPIRDNFGFELWAENHEGDHRFPREFPSIDPTEYNCEGEIRFMEGKRQIALQFIRHHPGEFLHLSAKRFLAFWTAPEDSAWWVVSLLASIGMALAVWRKQFAAAPYAIVLLVFPLIYYITHTFNSYRHPIEPEVLLMAAYALVSAFDGLPSMRVQFHLRFR
jgi:4-amino-4-deoxy-L-arabinose transferase-like glycosyltransferase